MKSVFDGADALIDRLGLDELLAEVRNILTGFELLVEAEKATERSGDLRRTMDSALPVAGGWVRTTRSFVLFQAACNERPAASHLHRRRLRSQAERISFVDLIHCEIASQGAIDLSVLIVPSDKVGLYLTDRVARVSEAMRHIKMGRFEDMPFVLIAMEHDGPGPRLAKMKYTSKT